MKWEPEHCIRRQQRLLKLIHEKSLTGVVVLQNTHVQWLTGVYVPPVFSSAAFLSASGNLVLIAPHKIPEKFVADTAERYDAKFHSTMRNDQNRACLEKLSEITGKLPGPVGVEYSVFGGHGRELVAELVVDVEPDLLHLRRRKEPDELAKIHRAISATGRMYEVARELIRPGVSEIEIFNELQSAAVAYLGEPLTGTGNDYQCNSRGGPPRANVRAVAGQLYILDLGPAFQGYFADNARTMAVSNASPQQLTAWEFIMRAFEHVESSVKPGKRCVELFEEIQRLLDDCPVGVFNHHLGHGIGLFPHEAPHLNPHWDDVFEVGDVFTAEPGLYDPAALRAGMRIENDYVVTEDGVSLLSDFPMEL